jgi:hypothetical protein
MEGGAMEQEEEISEIRAQIAKAYEALEVGDYEALPDMRDKIWQMFRQIDKGRPSDGSFDPLMKNWFDLKTEIDRALAADVHKSLGLRYTVEELEKLDPEKLDDVVEKLVFRRRPEPGLVARIYESWKQRPLQTWGRCRILGVRSAKRQKVPPYSQSYEGMGMILKLMTGTGYRVVILPQDVVRFISREGKRTEYVLPGWQMDLPRTVAIAAILAVQ